ncbi:hypothetical protein ACHAXN_001271 [Cyclotella atomus]
MIRAANVRPTVSARTYVYGLHAYNKMPLGPLGCRVQCFVGPDNRLSFEAHSTKAHYLRTSSNHYRCQEVLVTETKATRITDTLVFHHENITNPSVLKADAIVTAASELTTAIKGNMKEAVTKLDLKELERLAQIFEAATKKVSKANAGSPRVVNDDAEAPPPLQRVEDEDEDDTSEGGHGHR